MTRKLVYEALEKLQRGEIMKPDVMDVVDELVAKEIYNISQHNKSIIEDLRLTRERLKEYEEDKPNVWDDLGKNLSQ